MRGGMRGERRAAKLTGARAQPASGAMREASAKTDLRDRGRMRVESKETSKKAFTIKSSDLDKLVQQTSWDELPVFSIMFHNKPSLIALIPADFSESVALTGNKQISVDYDGLMSIIGSAIELKGAEYETRWLVATLSSNLEEL